MKGATGLLNSKRHSMILMGILLLGVSSEWDQLKQITENPVVVVCVTVLIVAAVASQTVLDWQEIRQGRNGETSDEK